MWRDSERNKRRLYVSLFNEKCIVTRVGVASEGMREDQQLPRDMAPERTACSVGEQDKGHDTMESCKKVLYYMEAA